MTAPPLLRVPECWAAIGRWYALPGVEQACLGLQDELGLDVTTALAALWLAVQGEGALSGAGVRLIAQRCAPWRQAVLEPLRRVRGALRPWCGLLGPDAVALREGLLAQELAAERLQLRLVLEAAILPGVLARSGDPCLDACLSLSRYLHALGEPRPSQVTRQRLLQLLCAALADYDGLQVARALEAATAGDDRSPGCDPTQ